ncbi:hypothetical protein R3P38DRAFT_2882327 [Favolaschia claudopus]|uniref:F-box domain-containing protein n=1 Tax=Favolaschia claudopus TaxID=2862362 RepID=A0AAW0D128_9AGAR
MLSNLSVELVQEIGKQLPRADHANLRAACKDLNVLIGPLFFEVLVLNTNTLLLSSDGVHLLETLAGGKSGWTHHAKTLKISSGTPSTPYGEEFAEQKLQISEHEAQNLLTRALAGLPNIRAATWCVFHVGATECGSMHWERATICPKSLHRFSLTSPNLDDSWYQDPDSPRKFVAYEQITQLVAQNSQLTVLHLDTQDEWNRIWAALRVNGNPEIKLREISSHVSLELFSYVASYSGIEKITLNYPDAGSENQSNLLADKFFEALSRHASSLVELSCPAAYENRFSFGTHNVDVVSRLRNLGKLEMSINARTTRIVHEPEEQVHLDGNYKRVPVLAPIGITVKAEQSEVDACVNLLLDTAAGLPALHTLVIRSADTEKNRGAWCGNGRINHTRAVDEAIGQAIKSFRTSVLSCGIVIAGCHTHELQATQDHDLGGSWAYRETGIAPREY